MLRTTDYKGRIDEVLARLPSDMSRENVAYLHTSLSSSLVPGSRILTLYDARLRNVASLTLTTTTPDLFTLITPCVMRSIGPQLRRHEPFLYAPFWVFSGCYSPRVSFYYLIGVQWSC
jgi:hypothetical protein